MTDLERLKEMMGSHKRIVFFGGAGVSTESNIPDFRGEHGLYKEKNHWPWSPEEMLSHHFYEEHPVEFFTMYKKFTEAMMKAKPNRAHYALSELEKAGKLSAVVTQNIDGLHQRAGSKNVIELHGTVLSNTCEKCFEKYDVETFLSLADPVPHCPSCGGIIKPDVVLYEESLDTNDIEEAIYEISNADMLIIGGTSLVVYPAAGFISYFRGDALVMINKDETPRDKDCDLVFHESVGWVLEKALSV